MNEAPKKIYLHKFLDKASVFSRIWQREKERDDYITYIRADLVDGMREALEVGLDDIEFLHGFINPGPHPCTTCASVIPMMKAALEAGKVGE